MYTLFEKKLKSTTWSKYASTDKCRKCNLMHSKQSRCSAENKVCRECQPKDHFAACCWERKYQSNRNDIREIEQKSEEEMLKCLNTVAGRNWK
ncbi:hypothetical protein GJ496_001773 [Pomphorhynchus laevis]|nr:hypothetical protein GJ496_001773 [Pomphorhynchus laevis]